MIPLLLITMHSLHIPSFLVAASFQRDGKVEERGGNKIDGEKEKEISNTQSVSLLAYKTYQFLNLSFCLYLPRMDGYVIQVSLAVLILLYRISH